MIGKPKDQECVAGANCPSFDVTSEQDELAGRPKLLTPFLTPLWDENQSWKEYRAYRETLDELEESQAEGEELAEESRPNKPLPSYAWQYRPEYQFSQFDFEAEEIRRNATLEDEEGALETSEDILNDSIPSIESSDELIALFYSLISADFNRLSSTSDNQELVLAFGEDEALVTVGEDQTVKFDNLESLFELDPEDYLSLRLYLNNDASNILWEWAFYLDLEFVDRFYEGISERSIASHPKPVIHLGKGFELQPFTPSDIGVSSGNKGSIKVFGKVYCDVADIVEGGVANIESVELRIPKVGPGSNYEVITVPIENVSDKTVKDIRPFGEGVNINSIEHEDHAFIGYFERRIDFTLQPGSVEITIIAKNALGEEGFGSISLKTEHDSSRYVIKDVTTDNRDETDRGVFEPVWVRVIDDDIVEENVASKKVTFLGADHGLVQHEDGSYYADKPFLFVTKPLLIDGVITNVRDVVAEPEDVAGVYDNQANIPPQRSVLGTSYTSGQTIVGDIEWEAKTYSYAAGSTVSIFWSTSPLAQGVEINVENTKIYELTKAGSRRRFSLRAIRRPTPQNTDFTIDTDARVVKVIKGDLVDGKQLYRFVVELDKNASEHKDKRIVINLEDNSDPEKGTSITLAFANFKAIPLKTVILAVDGLGFKTFKDVLADPIESPNFNAIFGGGKALGLDKPALSALPTITWANWPGVFSGGPPGQHGWLGNSFFPRESTSGSIFTGGNFKYPIFSSGKEGKPSGGSVGETVGLSLDAQQQLGVAFGGGLGLSPTSLLAPLAAVNTRHSYSMAQRSPTTAGSLYDQIADELGLTGSNPLNARSVKVFYEKSVNENVDLTSVFFGVTDPHAHSADAARFLDGGERFEGVNFQTLGRGSATLARDLWKKHGEKIDIMSIYLPGTDNAGHTFGWT